MAASLAVVKVEAERARVERSRSSWFQAPTNRPHPGPLARYRGWSVQLVGPADTLVWLLGRQRVGVGQAPLDPAAQILLLGVAVGVH